MSVSDSWHDYWWTFPAGLSSAFTSCHKYINRYAEDLKLQVRLIDENIYPKLEISVIPFPLHYILNY
jgi:hypothetical protein